MRLSELLGCVVVDERGRLVGRVHDVRLVQDGPPIGQFGASLRLLGLLVGRHAVDPEHRRIQIAGSVDDLGPPEPIPRQPASPGAVSGPAARRR